MTDALPIILALFGGGALLKFVEFLISLIANGGKSVRQELREEIARLQKEIDKLKEELAERDSKLNDFREERLLLLAKIQRLEIIIETKDMIIRNLQNCKGEDENA